MYTIQYETVSGAHKLQPFEGHTRQQLVKHLATFPHPITAVYEQVTVITKVARSLLKDYSGSKSRAAADFANSLG